jgi:glycine cleavage system H protein
MTGASALPPELKYTATHEWIREEGKRITLGITDHAQAELTDVVFVNLPAVGKVVQARESVLVLESVKTVADVYAPAAGKIVEVNQDLTQHPEYVNKDPYGKGWLVKIEISGPLEGTLTPAQYAEKAQAGGH